MSTPTGRTIALEATSPFARFADQRTILLTTHRKDGRTVGTPVNIAVEGPVAYIRTFDPSGKLKRMRRDPNVEIAPSTLRGKVTGETMHARVRILDGAESEHAGELLAQKHPLLQGKLVPWYHRRKGLVTTHLQLTAA